jgi:tetratricopeptide (TPR) repeat protein
MKNKQATALDAAGALALYAIVDGASPNHIEARDADGTVLAQAEAADLEHAAASLSRALAKGAGEAPERALPTSSMAAYAHYAVAENALESDRTGDAERELDAALKIDPAFSSAWLAKAMLIVDRGSGDSDMDLADEALSHVVDSALSDKERLFAAGYRDWVAARTDANVDKRPPHVEDAIDVLRKATVEFPEDMRSHYALGRVYNRLVGAHEEAVRHLENARRLAPDRLSVAKEYADAWLGAGQRSDAESIIKAYIRLVPEDERGRNALRDLGVIQAGTGSQTAVVR